MRSVSLAAPLPSLDRVKDRPARLDIEDLGATIIIIVDQTLYSGLQSSKKRKARFSFDLSSTEHAQYRFSLCTAHNFETNR